MLFGIGRTGFGDRRFRGVARRRLSRVAGRFHRHRRNVRGFAGVSVVHLVTEVDEVDEVVRRRLGGIVRVFGVPRVFRVNILGGARLRFRIG